MNDASLQPRLRESALMILLRHGTGEHELAFEVNEPGQPEYLELAAHRIKIQLNASSAAFLVKGGRWSGDRRDYPSAGAFVAEFEDRLNRALAGR
jgi:hypothetical protein